MSADQLALWDGAPGVYRVGRRRTGSLRAAAQALEVLVGDLVASRPRRKAWAWFKWVRDPYGLERWDASAARVFAAESVLASWALSAAGLDFGAASGLLLEDLGLVAVPEVSSSVERPLSGWDLAETASHLFGFLYPPGPRTSLGAFHTPRWLVSLVLDGAGLSPSDRVLDPGCGFGAFLAGLAERLGPSWPGRIGGLDVSPVSVAVSRCVLASVSRELRSEAIRAAASAVFLCNAFAGGKPPQETRQWDVLVGNPPWVAWEKIPASHRRRLARLAERWPALVPSGGFEASLGAASDDLATLFVVATANRFLKPKGRVHFVFKRSILENRTGGAFRAGGPEAGGLGLDGLEDLEGCGAVFGPGGGLAVVIRGRLGSETKATLPVRVWTKRDGTIRVAGRRLIGTRTAPPGSWTIRGQVELGEPLGARYLGERVRHGLKHDAERVFAFDSLEPGPDGLVWARRGRSDRVLLEPDRLFPYVKSRHVGRWRIRGWRYVLVVQDVAGQVVDGLANRLPRTWAYLEARRGLLEARASRVFRSGPFYTVFGLGEYSWVEPRVVWVGMGFRPDFALVGRVEDPLLGSKPVLVDGACYQMPAQSEEEGWFLTGLLNSRAVRVQLEAHRSGRKRGLGKKTLEAVCLPRFAPDDLDHVAVVEAARAAAEGDEDAVQRLEELARLLVWGSARS